LLHHGLHRVFMQLTVSDEFHMSNCLGYSEEFFASLLLCAGLVDKRGIKKSILGSALGLDVDMRMIQKPIEGTTSRQKQHWIRVRGITGTDGINLSEEEEATMPEHERAVQYFDEYWCSINSTGCQRDTNITPSLLQLLTLKATALEL
jgi:hypothetical protein